MRLLSMNQWFAAIFGDIYSLVNCRSLSDKLGCILLDMGLIRGNILLLGHILSGVDWNIFSHLCLNGSILLNCHILIRLLFLLMLNWWSLDMRNSDVEQALSWLIFYDATLEVLDHRFQRSADVLTVELLMLRLFGYLFVLFFNQWCR